MASTLKVAVIGLGNIRTVIASNLVKGNRSVIVADRSIEKATNLARKLGDLVQPEEISAAIKEADIIILAIWFEAIKEIFSKYFSEFEGKIIELE
jgi:predicted dinucleotide-binding enzyme